MNDYLRPGAPAADNAWPDYGNYDPQVDLGLGVVSPGGATLELRLEAIGRGEHGLWYHAGSHAQTPYSVMEMNAFNLGLIPGYTFTLARLPRGQNIEAFVGCQAGVGLLAVHGIRGDAGGNVLGDDDLQATAFEGGPLMRIQVPAGLHTSMGVEIGYRYEAFTDMTVLDAYGSDAGQASPAQTLRGSPASLDFSGPFVNLNIQFGSFQWSR